MDYWRYDRVTELNTKFSLSNAVCIPGLVRAFHPEFKEAAEDGAVILQYGSDKVKLTENSCTVTAKNLNLNATNDINIVAGGNVKISGSRVDIN